MNFTSLLGSLLCAATVLTGSLSAEDAAPPAPAPGEGKWVSLFNGQNLDGWTPKFRGCDLGVNYLDTFGVKDGLMTVRYDKYEKFDNRFGHIFYKDKFSHYRIRVEYRFVGEQVKEGPGWATRNNGIMLHCQDPKTMLKEQSFPVSLECQLLGGLGKGPRSTGNLCTPGTNVVFDGKLYTPHILNSSSKTFDGDQWVTVEAEVHGGEIIRHKVNGEVVLTYEKPQLDPKDKDPDPNTLIKDGHLILTEGYLSLQAESHPCDFRKIEIMVLEK